MTEDELRALVRQAVARHLAGGTEAPAAAPGAGAPAPAVHPSFGANHYACDSGRGDTPPPWPIMAR